MNPLKSFLHFVWDFVVGDDWRIAAGVVVALAIVALVANAGIPVWWIMPLAVIVLLAGSVWREVRAPRLTRRAQ